MGATAALCAACGGSRPHADSSPAGTTSAAATTTTTAHDPASEPPGAHESSPSPLTQDECEALLDHFLMLARGAHAATVAPELVPTDEQIAEIRAKLAATYVPACLSLTRAVYQCERAAMSIEEQVACSAGTSPR